MCLKLGFMLRYIESLNAIKASTIFKDTWSSTAIKVNTLQIFLYAVQWSNQRVAVNYMDQAAIAKIPTVIRMGHGFKSFPFCSMNLINLLWISAKKLKRYCAEFRHFSQMEFDGIWSSKP